MQKIAKDLIVGACDCTDVMQAQTASSPEAGPCAFAGKPLQRGVLRLDFKILLYRAQAIRCGQHAVEIRNTSTCFTLLSRTTRLRYFWGAQL
jgi:hypothetical protein